MHSNRLRLFATLMAAAGLTTLPACERSIGDDSFEIAQADEDLEEDSEQAAQIEDDRERQDPGTGMEEMP